jgi:hypothetical protein
LGKIKETIVARMILHPSGLKSRILSVICEHKQPFAFQVLYHALGKNVNVWGCYSLNFSDRLSISSGKGVPLLATTYTTLKITTVGISLKDCIYGGKTA